MDSVQLSLVCKCAWKEYSNYCFVVSTLTWTWNQNQVLGLFCVVLTWFCEVGQPWVYGRKKYWVHFSRVNGKIWGDWFWEDMMVHNGFFREFSFLPFKYLPWKGDIEVGKNWTASVIFISFQLFLWTIGCFFKTLSFILLFDWFRKFWMIFTYV